MTAIAPGESSQDEQHRDPPLGSVDAATALAALAALEGEAPDSGRLKERLEAARRAVATGGDLAHKLSLSAWATYLAGRCADLTLAGPVLESLRIDPGIPSAERIQILLPLANIRHALGNRRDALDACAEMDRMRAEGDSLDPDLDLEIDLQCGGIELDLGLPDLAARRFERARTAAASRGEAQRLRADLGILSLRSATEEYEEVLRLVDSITPRVTKPTRMQSYAAQVDLLAANAWIELSRETAEASGARARLESVIVDPTAHPKHLWAACITLAELDLRMGRFGEARESADAADRAFPRGVRSKNAGSRARMAAVRYEISRGTAAGEAEISAALDELREAARAQLDSRRSGSGRTGGEGWLWYGTHRHAFSTLVRAEILDHPNTDGVWRALQVLIDEQSSRSERSRGTTDSARELLERVAQPGRGVLVLFPSMERSHAFAWDAERGLEHFELERRDLLLHVTRELSSLISQPPWRDTRGESRASEFSARRARFSQAILPAGLAARVARWRDVLVVGAELILSAPIELALLPNGDELGQRIGVFHSTSLPYAAELAARPRPSESSEILVSTTRTTPASARALAPSLTDIPFDEATLDVWRDAAGPRSLRALEQADCHPNRLRAAVAGRAGTLVLVNHGVYDPAEEFPAGLVLDGGILRSADTASPGEPWPEAILLLACGAGRGVFRMGSDTATHLGTAFLEGGSRCVLVCRGELELEAATAFTTHLLRAWAEPDSDLGTATAIARAALANAPRTADPFFRGLIALHGVPPARTTETGPVAGSEAATRGENSRSNLRSILVPAGIGAAVAALVLIVRLRRSRSTVAGPGT